MVTQLGTAAASKNPKTSGLAGFQTKKYAAREKGIGGGIYSLTNEYSEKYVRIKKIDFVSIINLIITCIRHASDALLRDF